MIWFYLAPVSLCDFVDEYSNCVCLNEKSQRYNCHLMDDNALCIKETFHKTGRKCTAIGTKTIV